MAREDVNVDFIIAGQAMTVASAPASMRAALERAEHNFRKALGDIKVPKNTPIRIIMTGETTDRMKFSIEADEAVIQQVHQKLREATSR